MQPVTQLGEYQLLEKLGEGGMGAVYKALHTKLKRMVAIKILAKDRGWDDHAVARFEREMAAVGSLDHPNIVRAMDARELEGTRFLVMEYVEGADLNALGRVCHPLPIADACEIVRQAALGLEHAHRHGLVHRDVKCSNLMVTLEGVVKILDLGLARFQFDPAAGDDVTGTGLAMGTVDYMAPEQVSDSRSVDIRADIYSLGCTFYKLLAGRTPFAGPEQKSLMERLTAHASQPVPPVRRFRSDVPEKVVAVLGRMLAKHPSERFATPAEVADAVGPFAAASNLAVLVARAQGKPAPEPPPTQSLLHTQEIPSSSSGFKRLLRQIVGESATSAPRSTAGKRASRKQLALIAGFFGVGLICLVGVLILAFSSRRTDSLPTRTPATDGTSFQPVASAAEKTYLALDWPTEERQGATCELDGQAQGMERLDLLAVGGKISLPVTPGEHKLVMKRPGYEAFERSFTVTPGKDVAIRPTWKALATVAQPPSAVPPVGQASSPGRASPDKQPVPRTEKPPAATAAAKEAAGGTGVSPVARESTGKMPVPPPQESPEALAARKRLEALDARYAEAMKSVEALAAAWDFRGAAVELGKIRFEQPDLTARLAQRRDELKRMHGLRQKIIARINESQPPLKKSALGIRGLGGDVVKADDAGLTCKLLNGKSEMLAWGDLGAKATPRLVQLVVGGTGVSPVPRESTGKMPVPPSADDWIAAGLLALVCQAPTFAERSFDQARSLGTNIDRYLTPLASAAFARAKDLLDKKQFPEADAALTNVEDKYAKIPWFGTYKESLHRARSVARAGIQEAQAEKLYAEAAELFAQKEFFDLKPLVEKLKTDYPATRPVTDAGRKLPFSDLEKATLNLGKRLIVRRDGKGDFNSIQAAINAAEPKTFILIEDNGPYSEKLEIPAAKEGLTIRGRRGCWPVVTSHRGPPDIDFLVSILAPSIRLERLILSHDAPSPAAARHSCITCITSDGRFDRFTAASLKWCIVVATVLGDACTGAFVAQESLFVVREGEVAGIATNSLLLSSAVRFRNSVQFCTIYGSVRTDWSTVLDSIVTGDFHGAGHTRMEFCDVLGRVEDTAGPRRGCISADPMFRDPANLDFRLKRGSPCIGKASDGGDIGCRYTPEMIELCKEALELRRKGILKF